MCFLYAASAAGDVERMRGHLTPIAVRTCPLPCVYLQDTFGNGGARFISPAGYLQLNSWHLHKYLVVQALRLISAPCKGQGHADARSTCICKYVATYLHCNLLRTLQLNTQQRTKGICRSVKQQFHELRSPALRSQALLSSESVRS